MNYFLIKQKRSEILPKDDSPLVVIFNQNLGMDFMIWKKKKGGQNQHEMRCLNGIFPFGNFMAIGLFKKIKIKKNLRRPQ